MAGNQSNPFGFFNNDRSKSTSFDARQAARDNVSDLITKIRDLTDTIDKATTRSENVKQKIEGLLQKDTLSSDENKYVGHLITYLKGQNTYINNLNNQIEQLRQSIKDLRDFSSESKQDDKQRIMDQLDSQFGDSRISKAFYNKFVNKRTMAPTTSGKIVGASIAGGLQAQDRFIRRLVLSLGQLPVFQKVGRGITQFAGFFAMSGMSKLIYGEGFGEKAKGLGQVVLAGLIAILPTLIGSVSQTILQQLAEYLPQVGRNGWGTLAERGLGTKPGQIGTGALAKGIGAAIGIAIAAGGWNTFNAGRAENNGGKTDWGKVLGGIGAIIAGVVTVIGALVAGLFAPVTLIAAAIGAILLLVTNIDRLFPNMWKKITDWWQDNMPEWLGGKGDKNKDTDTPSYEGITPDQVAERIVTRDNISTDKGSKRWSKGDWDYSRWGDSSGQKLALDIDTTKYSKAELEAMAQVGAHGLETITGGNGIRLANTFYNDATAGRKGSNILLSLAAQRMNAKGYKELILTSALASATSGHSKGKTGHRGGQTFDFSALGMSKEEAEKFARDLYSTGLFSHAQAEYDKKSKQWHIDARLSDESFETLNEIAKDRDTGTNTNTENKNLQNSPTPADSPNNPEYRKFLNAEIAGTDDGSFHQLNIG